MLALAAAAASVGTVARDVTAATATWSNSFGNWSDPTKWSIVPTPAAPTFPDNGNGGQTYNVGIAAGRVDLDRDVTIDAMKQSGVDLLDIPAFLRKQAD